MSKSHELTPEDVEKVSGLAMLNTPKEKLAGYATQLGSILSLASQMDSFDLDDIEPVAHPHGLVNVYRPDEVEVTDVAARAVASAPDSEANQFKVPPALGEEL